jgi:hypothetical protein
MVQKHRIRAGSDVCMQDVLGKRAGARGVKLSGVSRAIFGWPLFAELFRKYCQNVLTLFTFVKVFSLVLIQLKPARRFLRLREVE